MKKQDIILPVTLFYDGSCPLCLTEVRWLQTHNTRHALNLIDIKRPDFTKIYPGLDPDKLDEILHAQLGNNIIVTGVDATFAAWEAVGKGWLLTPLRWPVLATIATFAYKVFARNRHTLSSKLGPLFGEIPCSGKTPPPK